MATGKRSRLTAFAAVFTVSDVTAALNFMVGRLGFDEHYRTGKPPSYAIVERGAVSLHLMAAVQSPQTLGRSSIYVFVESVDRLHLELQERGCPVECPPAETDYGMREMAVRDPDGNRITFGEELRTQLRALSE
ncbi:MAG: VOC family protein [Proteobacteria bacterium]|nr:VOC family protein [Pseudomonadota bacterium]